MKKYLAKSLLSAAIITSFFLGVEAFQRIRHPDANRAFRNPYWGKSGRGSKPSINKKSGTCRMLFIGGSTTYGLGNAFDETFPYLTQGMLNEKIPEIIFEAINAGECGVTSSGEKRRISELLYLHPDIVVIMTGYNDSAAIYGDAVKINQRGNLDLSPWYLKLDSLLLSYSVAYLVLREKFSILLHGNPTAGFQHWFIPSRVSDEEERLSNYRKMFRNNIEQMFEICSAHHAKPVFIKAPLSPQSRQNSLYAKAYFALMEELDTFCACHHIPIADLQEEVWNSNAGEYFQSDGLHFTKAGNALLASRLSSFLLQHKALLSLQ